MFSVFRNGVPFTLLILIILIPYKAYGEYDEAYSMCGLNFHTSEHLLMAKDVLKNIPDDKMALYAMNTMTIEMYISSNLASFPPQMLIESKIDSFLKCLDATQYEIDGLHKRTLPQKYQGMISQYMSTGKPTAKDAIVALESLIDFYGNAGINTEPFEQFHGDFIKSYNRWIAR